MNTCRLLTVLLYIGNQYTLKLFVQKNKHFILVLISSVIVQLIPWHKIYIIEDYHQRISNCDRKGNLRDLKYAVINRNARWKFWSREKREQYKEKSFFTITAEIHARSLAKFYGQYADRHMNLKFVRPVSERERQFDNLLS